MRKSVHKGPMKDVTPPKNIRSKGANSQETCKKL